MTKASKTELACLLTVMLAAAFSANTARAAIPGPYEIHRMPECDIAAEGQICRITVPNGDFEGLDDAFWHGEFQWFGFNTERHSMAAHLAPWRFQGPGEASDTSALALYNTALNTYRTVRLAQPQDRVTQWIPLPPADGEDSVYTVHAHVGSEQGPATVSITAAFDDGDQKRSVIAKSRPLNGGLLAGGWPTEELVDSVLVAAGSNVKRLGLRIEKVDGIGAVKVDDVVVVRSYPGQLPVDLRTVD